MSVSYQQLIDDHERIIDTANRLLSRIADKSYDADALADTLDKLAGQVRDHIAVEDAIIASDHGMLFGPWAATWEDGQHGVARLRQDWLTFIDTWNHGTIAENRRGFADAAGHLLGRLRERVQMETQAFYATALQTGVISLR